MQEMGSEGSWSRNLVLKSMKSWGPEFNKNYIPTSRNPKIQKSKKRNPGSRNPELKNTWSWRPEKGLPPLHAIHIQCCSSSQNFTVYLPKCKIIKILNFKENSKGKIPNKMAKSKAQSHHQMNNNSHIPDLVQALIF